MCDLPLFSLATYAIWGVSSTAFVGTALLESPILGINISERTTTEFKAANDWKQGAIVARSKEKEGTLEHIQVGFPQLEEMRLDISGTDCIPHCTKIHKETRSQPQ